MFHRIPIATAAGLGFGSVFCLLVRAYAQGADIPVSGMLTITLWGGVVGFVIGTSDGLSRWWLNGAVTGFVLSLPGACGTVWLGCGPSSPVWVIALGVVFGLLSAFVVMVSDSAFWTYCRAATRTAAKVCRGEV